MNRLSLDDFKLQEIDVENEIDLVLGSEAAAASCHTKPTFEEIYGGAMPTDWHPDPA